MSIDIDAYIERSEMWSAELTALRSVLLTSDLSEDIKWGKPCFSNSGNNIAIMQEFKGFLALMFFKGALLSDPAEILESQGPNSRSALRICFRSVDDVARLADKVAAYVTEAIAIEAAELEIPPAPALVLVGELQTRLDDNPLLAVAFAALTPGRQREYNLHISGAKKAETREARIDKYTSRILDGKGFRDR